MMLTCCHCEVEFETRAGYSGSARNPFCRRAECQLKYLEVASFTARGAEMLHGRIVMAKPVDDGYWRSSQPRRLGA